MIFVASFVLIGLFIAFMAVGVMMGRKPLKGSCGGLGKLMNSKCEFCGNRENCTKIARP